MAHHLHYTDLTAERDGDGGRQEKEIDRGGGGTRGQIKEVGSEGWIGCGLRSQRRRRKLTPVEERWWDTEHLLI